MTHFIGIDVAKYEHVLYIFNSVTSELIIDSLHFDNNSKGFNLILSNISKLDDCVIGLDSTANIIKVYLAF